MDDLAQVEVSDLLAFAKEWASLGDSVQTQVENVIDNPENDEVNPNAIKLAKERLGGMNNDIDQAFECYFDWLRAQRGASEEDE